MKKKNKWLKILLIVLGLLLLLGGVIYFIYIKFVNTIDNLSEVDMQYYFNEYTVKEENITSFVRGSGVVTSFNIKNIEIPEYATIKNQYVKDGATVKSKQKLFQISEDGSKKYVTSPIAGMFFEVENNSDYGSSFTYKVYDLNNMGIEFFVSETDVVSLKVGQKAVVKITVLNKEVEGKVTYVSKLPDEYEGRYKVKVKFSYFDELRFGYGASAKIVIEEKENAIVIPYNALNMDDDGKYYVVKEEYKLDYYNYNENIDEEKKTYVEVGTITNNQAEILSGLEVGDIILEWTW